MAPKSTPVSRRGVLKAAGVAAGAAAVAGGASLLRGAGVQQRAPAVLTNTQAGRKYMAQRHKEMSLCLCVSVARDQFAGGRTV